MSDIPDVERPWTTRELMFPKTETKQMPEIKSASDELLELAELAPMSAGTRTKLRNLALRVAAIERERTAVAKIGGTALRQLVDAVAVRPGEYGKTSP